MNEQLFWFSLIVGVTLFCVVFAYRDALRRELREQFWREHISKYNRRHVRERHINKGDK